MLRLDVSARRYADYWQTQLNLLLQSLGQCVEDLESVAQRLDRLAPPLNAGRSILPGTIAGGQSLIYRQA